MKRIKQIFLVVWMLLLVVMIVPVNAQSITYHSKRTTQEIIHGSHSWYIDNMFLFGSELHPNQNTTVVLSINIEALTNTGTYYPSANLYFSKYDALWMGGNGSWGLPHPMEEMNAADVKSVFGGGAGVVANCDIKWFRTMCFQREIIWRAPYERADYQQTNGEFYMPLFFYANVSIAAHGGQSGWETYGWYDPYDVTMYSFPGTVTVTKTIEDIKLVYENIPKDSEKGFHLLDTWFIAWKSVGLVALGGAIGIAGLIALAVLTTDDDKEEKSVWDDD